MAKYIISERQERLLKEISVLDGKYNTKPLEYFYTLLLPNILEDKSKKVCQLVREFFKYEMGVKINKWSDKLILKYLTGIKENYISQDFPHVFKKNSTISSLSYHLAKNLFKINEFQGLEYVKQSELERYRFFFFDPEIEEFVGYFETRKSLQLPGKSMKVLLSAVEQEYIGRGYGSRMYLCVLDQTDYLASDDGLFLDSLNIWVNYLPKKVNVWAELEEVSPDNNYEPLLVKLSPKTFINPDKIAKLIASSSKTNPPTFK
jgi:hypothetical protein